jgi:ABC-type branched-subunit amino acid transport system substrate-binding protein
MTRPRAIFSVTIGLALATLLGACGTPLAMPTPTPTPTPITPSGDGVLKIGNIVPTSGTYAFLGPAQAAGVEVAIREINEAGGVNGAPAQVFHRDEGDATSTKAEASFADLVAQGADVVIGPSSSTISERLIPLTVAAKIPLISPAATFPGLTSAKDSGYFFRTVPSYAHQGLALAKVLSEKGPAKVALVYMTDELGLSVAETLATGLEESGSELVASEGFPVKTTDFAPIIKNVADAKPDVVVLATAYSSFDTTKALITQLLAAGYGAGKLWLTTQNTGDYNQAFTPGTLKDINGIIEGYVPDDAFKERLKQSDPALAQLRYSAESYDATILAALAAIVAGDDSGESIASALENVSKGGIKCTSFGECLDVLKTQDDIDYDGISGPLNFTADGDVTPAWYGIYSYDGDNKFVVTRGIVAG